jgi:hypothetical protein
MRKRVRHLWRWITGQIGAERFVEEFIEKFPGRCMICSYHWYGITHGHCSPYEPVSPHYCIEGRHA